MVCRSVTKCFCRSILSTHHTVRCRCVPGVLVSVLHAQHHQRHLYPLRRACRPRLRRPPGRRQRGLRTGGEVRHLCDVHPALFSFLVWLGYINSFLNPVIYTVSNVRVPLNTGQTYGQTDIPTDRQTGKQTDRQTDLTTRRQTLAACPQSGLCHPDSQSVVFYLNSFLNPVIFLGARPRGRL